MLFTKLVKMHFVYILYSKKLNRFYIGETFDVILRLERHNSDYYENKYTSKGQPWEVFLKIECKDKSQAKNIEKHIKKMKSKKYIENLKKHPEISQKLLQKYSL